MDTMKIEVNGTKKAYEQTELIRFGVISGIYSAIPRRYLLYTVNFRRFDSRILAHVI